MTSCTWNHMLDGHIVHYDRVYSLIHYNLKSVTQARLQNQIPEGAS